ncbi:MAG: hypothetical protein ABI162_00755 [Luteolibacter sp.]
MKRFHQRLLKIGILFTAANLATFETKAQAQADPFAEPQGKSEAPKRAKHPSYRRNQTIWFPSILIQVIGMTAIQISFVPS